MGRLAFNCDGSLKLSEEDKNRLRDEQEGITLTKHQVNLNNPAIAQLIIGIGKDLKHNRELLVKEIYNLCETYIKDHFESVESNIKLTSLGMVVVEARSSWLMYSLLSKLTESIKLAYNGKYKIYEKGNYPKINI